MVPEIRHVQSRGLPGTCIVLLDVVSMEQAFCCLSAFVGKPFPAASRIHGNGLGSTDAVRVPVGFVHPS